jgi:hypothetical protein
MQSPIRKDYPIKKRALSPLFQYEKKFDAGTNEATVKTRGQKKKFLKGFL